MPSPRPEVVHSRVEREDPVLFFGLPLPARNGEWEFELVATRSWVEVLRRDFVQIDWNEITDRPSIPSWFTPDSERFTAWSLPGTSGIPSVHLFVERDPPDPNRVLVFIRRH